MKIIEYAIKIPNHIIRQTKVSKRIGLPSLVAEGNHYCLTLCQILDSLVESDRLGKKHTQVSKLGSFMFFIATLSSERERLLKRRFSQFDFSHLVIHDAKVAQVIQLP